MIKTIEVQLYGHPGNNAVVKMPNRQNPGIVVQADTLLQMARDARGLSEKLQVGSTRKIVASEANALAERLEQMFEHLKAQVNAIGEQITL